MPSLGGRNIISMPTYPAPQNISWKSFDSVAAFYSGFTGQGQFQDWQASWLEANVQMPNLKQVGLISNGNAQQWIAFLMACRGQTNAFLFGDPRFAKPQSGYTGTLNVSGGAQTGYALNVSGSAYQLTMGDCIQIGYRLYRVLSVIGSTLNIWPNIRESPPDGALITLTNCQGLFCLKNPTRDFSLSLQGVYGMEFQIREAI